MADDLTLSALRSLGDLKRRALVQYPCRACNDRPCKCDPPVELATRTYRPSCAGYANGCTCGNCPRAVTLRVVTPGPAPTSKSTAPAILVDIADCDSDPMVCECSAHRRERMQIVKRGPQGDGPAALRVKPRRAA